MRALAALLCASALSCGPGATIPGGGPRGASSSREGGSSRAHGPRTPQDASLLKGLAALKGPKGPDYRAALDAFERVLARRPDHREARINAAYCLLHLGRLDEAARRYERAQAKGDRAALLGLVDVLLRLDQPAKALEHADRWLKAHPEDRFVLALAAECHRHLGQPKRALVRVQRALALNRKDPWAHQQFGMLYLDRKDARTAMMIFNRGLKHDPKHALLHFSRGRTWLAQQEMGRAVMDFEAAVKSDPHLVAARLALGRVYVDNLDYKGALSHFEAVLSGWPNHRDALLGRARALFGLRRFKESLDGYRKVLAVHPREARALYQIGRILQQHLERPQKALSYYRRFVKARSGLPKDDPVFATIKMLEATARPARRGPPSRKRVAPPRKNPGSGGDH